MYFPTPLACLMGRGVFFQFRWATDWLQSRCRSCPPDTHYVCVRSRRGREQGGPLLQTGSSALRPFDWRVFPPKLVHADRLSDPLAENDVYEQEQSGLW